MPPTINRRTIAPGQYGPLNTEPDWKGAAELSIIAQIIREKYTFYTGEAEVHPLHINNDRISKYRANFVHGTNIIDFNGKDHGQSRSMLATAYIVVRWINCLNNIDTTGRSEACWEPEPLSVVFTQCYSFGKNPKRHIYG